ncbi:MAG TPA: NAD(+)/NADH kinase [Clostridia bacterium]|nr:NAD(+)/NADH kinase [Clostridia bacterium]
MILALQPNLTRNNSYEVTLEVCAKLDSLHAPYLFDIAVKEQFIKTKASFLPYDEMLQACDILITIGGDGTIIHAAKSAVLWGKPILGVNAGRLAFMAGLERHEIDLLGNLLSGDYSVDKRMMLKTRLIKDGQNLACEFCINDTVVSRAGRTKPVELSVECHGRHIAKYVADGLILATPTGSTAYSLSAGGPIVDPTLESILLTPICAHSLFARSFILNTDSELTVRAAPGSEASFSCDGEDPIDIPEGCCLNIGKAEAFAQFIRIKSDTFTDVLNNKLVQWNR